MFTAVDIRPRPRASCREARRKQVTVRRVASSVPPKGAVVLPKALTH